MYQANFLSNQFGRSPPVWPAATSGALEGLVFVVRVHVDLQNWVPVKGPAADRANVLAVVDPAQTISRDSGLL